jgi:hypothetical protein
MREVPGSVLHRMFEPSGRIRIYFTAGYSNVTGIKDMK